MFKPKYENIMYKGAFILYGWGGKWCFGKINRWKNRPPPPPPLEKTLKKQTPSITLPSSTVIDPLYGSLVKSVFCIIYPPDYHGMCTWNYDVSMTLQ